jgi:DNA-binding transcriptional LysR family regulator
MNKFFAMKTFVEICDRGSLTAAGESLGKSQPTIVRVLANLEESLGVRLLRRTTRRLALTAEGRGYLTQCRRILADIDNAERGLIAGDSEPRGQLRITAPVTFGQRHVAPITVAFRKQYPDVEIELLLLDRVVNLLEEGIDLAVRIGVLADSSMIATNVGSMRRVLVASPELLAQIGPPERPEDLSNQAVVLFRGLSNHETWQFRRDTKALPIEVRGVYGCNQATPAVDACVAGIGFGMFLAYQVHQQLRSGELRVLLEEFEVEPAPVSLVYSDARLMSPSLRVLIDFARDRLRANLIEIA